MRKTLLAAAAGAAVTAAIVGGVAWATIPAPDGVIKACYQQNGGQLRVIESTETCRSSELPISWNQTGSQGSQGPTGPRGVQGPTGLRGIQGLQGQQGIQGPNGVNVTSTPLAVGDPNCPTGGTELVAASGTTYACNGAAGARGPSGATGDQGQQGPAGPTGPSGSTPVAPPSPWSTRTGNQVDSTFSLELESGDALRVSSFAGCLPTTVDGRPTSCYFTIRGFPDSLANWLNDTLDGNLDAVQDLTVRGPFAPFSGTPAVQFRLHNAFITNASIALDANSSDVGEVELVVATNTFQSETPTSAPPCDCSNVFFQGNFSLEINGSDKPGILKIDGLGFSVPRLGSTNYVPGTPSIEDLHVGVTSSNSPGFATTRTFFTTWANNVAQGNTDQRDGTVDLLSNSLSLLAHIDISNLEPLTLFDPMAVDGAQSITFSADQLEYHP
jgi:Collagen triple helix repeat (20 copies)